MRLSCFYKIFRLNSDTQSCSGGLCSPGGGRGWLHPRSENLVERDFSRVDYVRKTLDRTYSLLRPCLQNLTATGSCSL